MEAPERPPLRLWASSLLQKWGFGDGDCLEELYWDWANEAGRAQKIRDPRMKHCLVEVVRRHVVPALDQIVEVTYDPHNNHNPARAATIDGTAVDDAVFLTPPASEGKLTPEVVDVAWADVVAVFEHIHGVDARTAWSAHLDRCDACNHERPCMPCESGVDDGDPAGHACNCSRSTKPGWRLHQAAAAELAELLRSR